MSRAGAGPGRGPRQRRSGSRRPDDERSVFDNERLRLAVGDVEADLHRFGAGRDELEAAVVHQVALAAAGARDRRGRRARSSPPSAARSRRSERVLAGDRGLIRLRQRQIGVARVGVAERLEVLQHVGGGRAAGARVAEQRDAVRTAVPLHPGGRRRSSLDDVELSHHRRRVDRRPGAVGDQVFGDRPVADVRRRVDRRLPVAVSPVP